MCLFASGASAAECSQASQTERWVPKQFPKHLGALNSNGEPRAAGGGCGVSVAYAFEEEGLVCTLFVYDGGRADIGTGTTAAVEAEFPQVLAAIDDKSDPWLGAKTLKPALEARVATFTLRDGQLESMAFLTGYRGQFLKLRCTNPSASAGAKRAMWGFVTAVGERLDELITKAPSEK